MRRPVRQGSNQDNGGGYMPTSSVDVGYGGGTSYHGAGADYSSSYSGYPTTSSTSSSSQSPYRKERSRKQRGGGGSLPVVCQPWMLGVVASVFFCILALYFNSQKSHLLKQLQVKSVKDAAKTFKDLKYDKKNLEREVRKLKTFERKASDLGEKYSALDVQNRKTKKELQDLRAQHKSAEAHQQEVEAYRDMITQLKQSAQRESKREVLEQYGPGPHRVRVSLILPSDKTETELSFTIEMAPLDLMPHAIHLFLEQVSHGLWNNGWFYINGPHVIQCGPQATEDDTKKFNKDARAVALEPFKEKQLDTLAFPEYSEKFPHVPWTIGFTGRPGGPDWYINKKDNTKAHGPGGQNHHEVSGYGDPCFAKVVDGFGVLDKVFKEKTVPKGEYRFFYEEPVQVVNAVILSDDKKQDAPKKKEEQGPKQKEEGPKEKEEGPKQKEGESGSAQKNEGRTDQSEEKEQLSTDGEKTKKRKRPLVMTRVEGQVEP